MERQASKGMTRRGFFKGAALGGASIAALGLASGCSAQPKSGEAASASAEPVSENGPVSLDGVANPATMTGDGRYVTKAMGHEDYIYVATELWDGAITSCRVIS